MGGSSETMVDVNKEMNLYGTGLFSSGIHSSYHSRFVILAIRVTVSSISLLCWQLNI